jgi:biotin carboxyl carrier protein
MRRLYRWGDRRVGVALQRSAPGHFVAVVDGHSHHVEAELLDASTLRLVVDRVVHTVQIARVAETYHIAIAGEVYTLTPETPGGATGDRAPALAPPQIVAPMPGRVLSVLVRAGQGVGAGDGLLLLEAMKMEHRIAAEAPATVRAVHVADGQMVDAGELLVELDYDP